MTVTANYMEPKPFTIKNYTVPQTGVDSVDEPISTKVKVAIAVTCALAVVLLAILLAPVVIRRRKRR